MTSSDPESSKDRVWVLCLILSPLVAFVAFHWGQLSGIGGCHRAGERAAESLLQQLSQAIAIYELDYTVYPPGDGTGSAGLVRGLSLQGKHGNPLMALPEDLHPKGGLRNPVNPELPIHYRQPGLHNPQTYDLWCQDSKGRPAGINNWQR